MTNRSVRERLLDFHGVEDMSQLQPEAREKVKQQSEIKTNPYSVVSRAWKMYQEARRAKKIENIICKAEA